MQTPAEKCLIQNLSNFLHKREDEKLTPAILNIGAGRSVSIEEQLARLGCTYICDRVDVVDCSVVFPMVRRSWVCSVEAMKPVGTGSYCAAFANYVLEHVRNLDKASREIARVLTAGGIFIATVPNPKAPEFIVAKLAPFRMRKAIIGGEPCPTEYSYKGIPELIETFVANGFTLREARQWAFTESYLWKWTGLHSLSKLYDRIVAASKIASLKGNVCLTFEKTSS